jgi:hypothetical protein
MQREFHPHDAGEGISDLEGRRVRMEIMTPRLGECTPFQSHGVTLTIPTMKEKQLL